VACIVTDGPACGIDVEASNVDLDLEALGEQVLTPAERAEMASLADGRVERFLRLWTLKEAYAKACGLGLAMPFDELAFTLGDEIELSRDADWTFGQWPVPPAHILSVAVRGQVRIEFRSAPGW
jgi:4'-phosphopantetheinyl transferase